ncbi:MAG: transcriptional regulator [Methanobrevibacter sp.]|nr:transcriptional regulator [Methanobrevibacter sp.]
MDEKTVNYVKKSSYRLKVLQTIGEDVKMPNEISRESGILQNHISNVLKQLRDKDLVECINPEVRKGRLYRANENGLEVLKEL